MNELIKGLIAWILIITGYTLPIVFVLGELKIWFKVWFIIIVVALALMASGLWLLGVR